MALETSDLNDGTILQQTRQLNNDKGQVQFVIKLPSGRDLKSEWMRKDDARAGMRQWLEVVKQQAIADSNEERLERAARARRGKMDIERKPGDDQPLFRAGGARGAIDPETGEEKPLPTPGVVGEPQRHVNKELVQDLIDTRVPTGTMLPDPAGEVEPTSFAEKQLAYYDQQVRQYQPLLEKAVRRRHQWQTVLEALQES
jgi:hypothetical protein